MRFSTFPRTEPPPDWASAVVDVFRKHESEVGTEQLAKGLTSDQVLSELAADLQSLGFNIEKGKTAADRIDRPVFFGDDGKATVRYQVDGYHPGWRCGIEIEAGRAWMGNAVYRDLIQAMVMVDVDWLCLAVPLAYKFKNLGKNSVSKDFENARGIAEALFGHTRVKMPYRLLLVGY